VRRERDNGRVKKLLDELATTAKDPAANLMPVTIELAKARATMGEIVARLKDVFGTYTETPYF
jgi:methylmalonyl-CoA mutase N-terminal domain/subunit